MEIAFLLVADYANVAEGGKLNIMGVFTSVRAHTFPAAHGDLFVISQVVLEPEEYGQEFTYRVDLIDEDGARLRQFTLRHKPLPAPPPPLMHMEINQIVRFANTVFPRPGVYEFIIWVDDEPKARRSIQARHIPPPNLQT